jgi:hypothetical protein
MKTPMQEVIDDLKQLQDVISFSGNHYIQKLTADLIQRAESKLEKEEEMIKKAWWAGCDEGASDHKIYPSEDCNGYYNETFNTKER